jgi:hypothetical protein
LIVSLKKPSDNTTIVMECGAILHPTPLPEGVSAATTLDNTIGFIKYILRHYTWYINNTVTNKYVNLTN